MKLGTLALHTTAKPELGSPNYGYGTMLTARMAPRPLIGHGGNAAGQCTEFGRLTDTPYTVIVLSNVTVATCIVVTAKVLDVLAPADAAN